MFQTEQEQKKRINSLKAKLKRNRQKLELEYPKEKMERVWTEEILDCPKNREIIVDIFDKLDELDDKGVIVCQATSIYDRASIKKIDGGFSGKHEVAFWGMTCFDFSDWRLSWINKVVNSCHEKGLSSEVIDSYRNALIGKWQKQNQLVTALCNFWDSLERVPFFVSFSYTGDMASYFINQCLEEYNGIPQEYLMYISHPDVISYETSVKPSVQKTKEKREQTLENELCEWLSFRGIPVEKQVSANNKHRLDIWIPDKLILELKASRVTGDDVCQAIDYASTYKMPIILVGNGLTTSASRGIEGFNKAVDSDSIVFVTWSGIKPYLKAQY